MARLMLALVVTLCITGCIKDEVTSNKCDIEKTRIDNNARRTITQGVYGTVGLITGDCMPIVDPRESRCIHCPAKRTVQIYEYTTISQAVRSTTPPYYFEHFNTQKLAETEADEKGFYEINIGPGHYTIVTIEDGKIYANISDGLGGINPITIESNVPLRANLTVSKAVY
jgi:hypothetical protein